MSLDDLPVLSDVPKLRDRPVVVELGELWDKESGEGAYHYYIVGIVKDHHPWWNTSLTCDVIVCQLAAMSWEERPGELISICAALQVRDIPRHGYRTVRRFQPGQYVFREARAGEIVSY